ncbi:MAG: 2-polyprenyl-6-methoxyphenol hydroxylase-like oxidoreductase [Spirulina sp. SIO3F2]|nr:2-polyprenyl-6-methoxyphenol hydroxylase-like oxidoreductase [Spirulina sp. SIO3F2]
MSQFSDAKAIVIGGGIAGLLASRVLLDHFERVLLLEKDQLSDEPELRPGVVQAPHLHGLLVQGYRILEDLFPSITDDLTARGARVMDCLGDWQYLTALGWLPQFPSGLKSLICSRMLLEWYLRQQLMKQQRFEVRSRLFAQSLCSTHAPTRISGIVCKNLDTHQVDTLTAHLIVDASGRSSRLPSWLAKLNCGSLQTTTVDAFIGYASRWYRRPPELNRTGLSILNSPGVNRRGGTIFPIEGDRFIISLSGFEKDYPSNDEAEFLAFAKSLPHPVIYNTICDSEPISPIYTYRGNRNYLRHYENIVMPAGIVALGNAVCGFNPKYGQGMTAAALGARTLADCLARHPQAPNQAFSQQFQRHLAKTLKTPWSTSIGQDLSWGQAEGKRPERPSWLAKQMNYYIDRVAQVAHSDPQVCRELIGISHLTTSPSAIFHPRILWKVFSLKT